VTLLAVGIIITAVDGLLLLRVMALYALRPRLRLLMKTIYVFENIVQYSLVVLSFVQTAMLVQPSANSPSCVSWMNNPLMYIVGLLPSFLFNVVLFSFIAYALLPFWKRGSWTPMFQLFLRDGALYVFIIAGTECIMIITIYTLRNRETLMLVMTAWLISVLPIASCRLVLNLRGMLRGPRTDSTTHVSSAEPSVIDIRRTRTTNDTGFTFPMDDVMLEEMEDRNGDRGK